MALHGMGSPARDIWERRMRRREGFLFGSSVRMSFFLASFAGLGMRKGVFEEKVSALTRGFGIP
jgi:hypothetical protein